jgi:Tfp pilus assembly protein PilE
MVEATDEVMKGCRALVALSCATPGILGSSYQDAQDLLGQESAPTSAQLVLRTAVWKHSEWKKRTLSFWSEASDDCTIAPLYKKRAVQWSEVSASDLTADMIDSTFQDIAAWQKKLRPSACDDLLNTMLAKAKFLWNDQKNDIDTTLLQALVTNLLKYVKDSSLREVSAALQSKSASIARDLALAKFVKAMTGFQRVEDDLLEVSSTFGAVEGSVNFTEELTMQMHNFRGHLVEVLQTRFVQVTQRTSAESSLLQVAASIAKGFAAVLTNEKSNRCECFVAALELALDLKTAVSEIRMEHEDGGGVKPTTLVQYFAVKRKYEDFIEKGKLTEAKSVLVSLASSVDQFVRMSKQLIEEASAAALRLSLQEVAQRKGRLDRVAGGTDDGKNWKGSLDDKATLQSDDMKAALKVVEGAFCSAIDTRSRELKEARGRHVCQQVLRSSVGLAG